MLTASIYESVNHILKLKSLLTTNPQICSKNIKNKVLIYKKKTQKDVVGCFETISTARSAQREPPQTCA